VQVAERATGLPISDAAVSLILDPDAARVVTVYSSDVGLQVMRAGEHDETQQLACDTLRPTCTRDAR